MIVLWVALVSARLPDYSGKLSNKTPELRALHQSRVDEEDATNVRSIRLAPRELSRPREEAATPAGRPPGEASGRAPAPLRQAAVARGVSFTKRGVGRQAGRQ